MTSESELQKTSEFLRRRKLRLQQVREQSKDIAKIIRQRAKVEKLRQVVEFDASKEKDYLQRQEKVVKKLEELHSKALDNVGSSHKASSLRQPDLSTKMSKNQVSDNNLEKTDLSRQRGRDAAAELKKKNQQKLDERKKSLERKVRAREIANEISREKSAITANKFSTKSSSTKVSDETISDCQSRNNSADKSASKSVTAQNECTIQDLPSEVNRNDMATQWDTDLLPNEWEPNVPTLTIPKDDSTKESLYPEIASNSQRQKRPNLFAVSDEMPSTLRGSHHYTETGPSKPSLTLVSEYIQNRALRLREPGINNASKKQSEDLQILKQTILRSRTSKTEGSGFNNICHVLEGQVIPVPTWHAETNYQHCSPCDLRHKQYTDQSSFANVTNSQINKIFSSIRQPQPPGFAPTPVVRRMTPFVCYEYSDGQRRSVGSRDGGQLLRSNNSGNAGLSKKKSVTMYHHSTKDTKDVPFTEPTVARDEVSERDAYSEALDEATATSGQEKQNKKLQDMTNKIAVTRQNVEKEYKDTITFLNGLPKSKATSTKPVNNAYKDDYRLQMQRDSRQRTLQQEFRNIERDSRLRGIMSCKTTKHTFPTNHRLRRSKSPFGANVEDNFNERDFQYSWMPVPEGDGNLAVHTIPTALKEGKSGNSVKFSKVDSYHEYRSRHKHTPPTKDTNTHEKKCNKRYAETVIIRQQNEVSSSGSSIDSNNSSTEDLRLNLEKNHLNNDSRKEQTEAERIIIYNILDLGSRKNCKSVKKVTVDDTRLGNEQKSKYYANDLNQLADIAAASKEDAVAVDNLDPAEGIYKVDCEKGDNITSIYYSKAQQEGINDVSIAQSKKDCLNNDKFNKETGLQKGPCKNNCEDDQQSRKACFSINADKSMTKSHGPVIPPSTNTSAVSFNTAIDVKQNTNPEEGGYIKLIDEGGREKGNIFIGATGFLTDDAYEVVIQLRKKDTLKKEAKKDNEEIEIKDSSPIKATEKSPAPPELAESVQPKTISIEHCPEPMNIQRSTEDSISENLAQQIGTTRDNNEVLSRKTEQPMKKCDRSIPMLFKEECPNSSLIPKTDPILRSATSSYTQASHSSPNSRPVFIHMSSSTSTAYMSPPEVVLPSFLKRGCESFTEAHHDVEGEKHGICKQRAYYNKHSGCHCRSCVSATKAYLSKIQSELELIKMKTPPNTARSFETDVGYSFDKTNRESTHSSLMSSKPNHRCNKRKTKGTECCIYHFNKNKCELMANKRMFHKRNTKSAVLCNKTSKTYFNNSKNCGKSYLKPMIKDYINKLLSLNREGIKAIQIFNQECSSVNTPASSIINVPTNLRRNKPQVDFLKNGISLEKIKKILRQQFLEDYDMQTKTQKCKVADLKIENLILKNKKLRKRNSKKRAHKVKSLNISKKIRINSSDVSLSKQQFINTKHIRNSIKKVSGENVSPLRHLPSSLKQPPSKDDINSEKNLLQNGGCTTKRKAQAKLCLDQKLYKQTKLRYLCEETSSDQPKTIMSSKSSSSDSNIGSTLNGNIMRQPINTSTQTLRNIHNEINLMKLAEDKLQNMEKIADLTEKCTKRLSNLAKVLEVVRKNKSLVYSQISTSDSTDSNQKYDKVEVSERTEKELSNLSMDEEINAELKASITATSNEGKECEATDYDSILFGIPKPREIKTSNRLFLDIHTASKNMNNDKPQTSFIVTKDSSNFNNTICRSKPPPALLRIHLKRPQENVVPHELSTVIEVDSPMSVKLKNQSSSTDTGNQIVKKIDEARTENMTGHVSVENHKMNPVLQQDSVSESNNSKMKKVCTDYSDDSKLRMMDLNQFNEIMLKPFISLQEYAQECYGDDVALKHESVSKDAGLIDDISSLHSDGSLPDVVAELLKRKLITEPFKFDTASNINSTTISSDSTLSVLALSKARKDKSKTKIIVNTENVAETSDTLSISSNPDLENAFKKMGLGWASSTLKKTKERLALSSSSNTSSSSLSQFKYKNSIKHDMPTIVTDSVSSVPNVSKKPVQRHDDTSKNAEQQTSLMNSMTVKEFLTNELAKKITFSTDKSCKNISNEEYISLLETKMPEELKKTSHTLLEENSGDTPNGNNNRARTSTPVQIFKSVTYHSSSSSNISNGLFSNADDLSSVKLTSNSMRYHSTSEKDELTIPNYSLKMRKGLSDCSKTDSC